MSFSADPISERSKVPQDDQTRFLLEMQLMLQDLVKTVDKLVLSIEGNGKPGLKDRVFVVERDIQECRNFDQAASVKIKDVRADLEALKEKTTSWQLKIFQALMYLAAGSGTTAAVFKMLSGNGG